MTVGCREVFLTPRWEVPTQKVQNQKLQCYENNEWLSLMRKMKTNGTGKGEIKWTQLQIQAFVVVMLLLRLTKSYGQKALNCYFYFCHLAFPPSPFPSSPSQVFSSFSPL